MNFIKVHNRIDEAVLINAEMIQTTFPAHNGDFPNANTVVIFDNDKRIPNYITETVDELAAMLLPGPVVKELEPATIHLGAETGCPTVESFLRTMRDGVSNECDRHGSCEACRHKEQSVVCWFRSLTGGEIRTIAAEYKRLRRLEQQEASNG